VKNFKGRERRLLLLAASLYSSSTGIFAYRGSVKKSEFQVKLERKIQKKIQGSFFLKEI